MAKSSPIYLDYNATTPLLPCVKTLLHELMEATGNPSSIHQAGKRAKHHLTKARHYVGAFLGAHPDYVIFTSGGTEANNQALRAAEWDHVLISAIEHDSVLKARDHVTLIPVDEQGLIDLKSLEQLLALYKGQRILVSIIWANNETGVIQPMDEIVRLAKHYNAAVHTDAVQAVGKIPIHFEKSGLDMMSFSGHKFGAPQGGGALLVKETVPLGAFIRGGGQERNRRGGTENIMAIAGLGEALQNLPSLDHLKGLQHRLESALKKKENVVIFSEKAPRLPNTTSVAIPGLSHINQVIHFDLNEICVSAGSACSSGKVGTSRVLEALTQDVNKSSSAIRISTGWNTREEDITAFINIWSSLYDDFMASRKKST